MVKTKYAFFGKNGKCVYRCEETRPDFARIRLKHALGLTAAEADDMPVYVWDSAQA